MNMRQFIGENMNITTLERNIIDYTKERHKIYLKRYCELKRSKKKWTIEKVLLCFVIDDLDLILKHAQDKREEYND